MKEPQYIWCAWRTKSGWSARHAVPTREDDNPEDVKGFFTMCMKRIPDDAREYDSCPHGPIASRAAERFLCTVFGIDRSSGDDICRHCKRILEWETDLIMKSPNRKRRRRKKAR